MRGCEPLDENPYCPGQTPQPRLRSTTTAGGGGGGNERGEANPLEGMNAA